MRPAPLIQLLAAVVVNAALITASAHAGYAHLIIDANNGKVLRSQNADTLNHPASLTKMMTLYLVFEALHDGRLRWDQSIVMTNNGAATIPFKLDVPAGKTITVKEAVYGMMVKSANDAAEAIGDHLAGSETNFGQMMTRKARQLGMKKTVFRNGSGLPDKLQVTTARDMAGLAIALMLDFPKEYALFSTPAFSFRGKLVKGHNHLMYRYKGMDGIKTGYINASGFNIVTAVNENGKHVVGVVLGGKTARSRDNRMAALLDEAMPAASVRRGTRVAQALMKSEFDLPQGYIPLPVAAVREHSPVSNEVINSIAPRPEIPGRGWIVQIAATNSHRAAQSLLAKAQVDALAAFNEISPYTEMVNSGSDTLYRVRFSGFSSRSSAMSACQALQRSSYACFVLSN